MNRIKLLHMSHSMYFGNCAVTLRLFSRRAVRRSSNVRVRFAPSPTGDIHIGGLRTALYNYLFAKKHGGKFVLRIEDTDQNRLMPGVAENIEATLDWAGIPPDESPKKGGEYGPYVQSLRCNLYQYYADELIESGAAYRCFCSDYRLQLVKKEALRRREVPRYDNRCRRLTDKDVELRLDQGLPYTVRLKLTDEPVAFHDLVYGELKQRITDEFGDFIIMKSDNFPTYHLANVVDDHLMEISHVLRGNEWITSTGKHIMLYRALGWKPPQFAHLPLILNQDGGKLSKREGHLSVNFLKESGYLPESVLNFLTLIGGGFPHSLNHKVAIKEELVRTFEVGKIKDHSARLEMHRLDSFNRNHLADIIHNDDETRREMVDMTRELLLHTYSKHELIASHVSPDSPFIAKILAWSSGRLVRVPELAERPYHYLWIRPQERDNVRYLRRQQSRFRSISIGEILDKFLYIFESISEEMFTRDHLNKRLIALGEQDSINYFSILRPIIAALQTGPPLPEMLEVLGREECLVRVSRMRETLRALDEAASARASDAEGSAAL